MPPPKKNTTKAQTVFFGRETAVRREDVSKLRRSIESDANAEVGLIVSDILDNDAGEESESPPPPPRKGAAATRKRARSSPSPPPQDEPDPSIMATPSKRQRRADKTAAPATPRRSARHAALVTTPVKTITAPAKRGRGRPAADPKHHGSQLEWEVEKIVDSQVDAATKEHFYRVKWKGFPHNANTWEPRKNLTKCTQIIKAFEKGSNKRR